LDALSKYFIHMHEIAYLILLYSVGTAQWPNDLSVCPFSSLNVSLMLGRECPLRFALCFRRLVSAKREKKIVIDISCCLFYMNDLLVCMLL